MIGRKKGRPPQTEKLRDTRTDCSLLNLKMQGFMPLPPISWFSFYRPPSLNRAGGRQGPETETCPTPVMADQPADRTIKPDSHLQCIEANQAMESERLEGIKELIKTEESYINNLYIAQDAFYNAIGISAVMTPEELNTIFPNWTRLILCNTGLIKSIKKNMAEKDQIVQNIGNILCKMIPKMKSYIEFGRCFPKAKALLQWYKENSFEFQNVYERCLQNPKTKNEHLDSFLIQPVQRITRYPPLIQRILKNTPDNHLDRCDLQKAYALAKDLCNEVNEGIRMTENSDNLEWIQNNVQCEGLGENLIFDSVTNCSKPRELLFYGTLKKPLFMDEISVQKFDGNPCWLQLSNVDRTYTFKTSTPTERDLWINHIEEASKDYNVDEHDIDKPIDLQNVESVGQLLVVLLEGCDLQQKYTNGKMNLYCKLELGQQMYRSKVIHDTSNPSWNTVRQYAVRNLNEDVFCITVLNRHLFSPDVVIGHAEVRIHDILDEPTKIPITKRLRLNKDSPGEVVVNLSLRIENPRLE